MFPQLLLLILMITLLSNCLARCVTTQGNKRLECTNLYDFPQGTDSTEVLQATNSTLIKIASNIFPQKQFASLKVAVLQYDNIRVLAKRAFNGLSSLILLDLTRNELEELHISAFQGAEFLKVLILTENRIQHLDEQTFEGLNSLLYMDLSHNNISDLPKTFLEYLPSIKYLDVSHNPLNSSRAGSFLKSTSLAILRISLCKLQEISTDFFADLPNLEVLDLSGSNLKVWPEQILYPLPKLRVLYVDTLLLVNENTFVPSTVEKFVQSEMDVNSRALVIKILENLDDVNVRSMDIELLQYLEDSISEDKFNLPVWKPRLIQKILLFSLLVYLSFMFTLCLSQIIKSLIQKPYQRIYLDEI